MFHVDQVRLAMEVGARSLFQRGDEETSSCNSTKSRVSDCSVAVVIDLWLGRLARASAGKMPTPHKSHICAHAPRRMNCPSPGRPLYFFFSIMALPEIYTVSLHAAIS